MKNAKKRIFLISLLIFSAFILFGVFRICVLNKQYPNPQEIYFHTDETCTISGYHVRLTDMELRNGEEIKELSSGMPFLYNIDGTPYPWEKQKLILAEIEIEGTDNQDIILDLTQIVLEKKAWGNGIEGELFSILNGENDSVYVKLAAGEKQTILCPFLLNDMQFRNKDWENMSVDDFSLILGYYPEKVILST